MLLSNQRHIICLCIKQTSYYQTTNVIIKHLILSTPQLIILTLDIVLLLSHGAALARRGATGRVFA